MADEARIPCRCLLADSLPELHVSVAEYIALLDERQKAPEAAYRSRLAICLGCSHLRDGTCGLCGCYVEARAAKRVMRCPDIPPRWERLPEDDD